MNPYFYAPIHFRPKAEAERVTIGVLIAAADRPHVEVASARVGRTARVDAQGVQAAREAIEDIEAAARHISAHFRTIRHDELLNWWTARAAQREDFVQLAEPLPGLAADLHEEAARLLFRLTGFRPEAARVGRASAAIRQTLQRPEFREAFGPRLILAGDVPLHYARVHQRHHRLIALEPFDLEREASPERVVFRAGRELTKAELLRRADIDLRSVLVAVAPEAQGLGRAWRQALDFINEAGARVVPADSSDLQAALEQEGILAA